MAVTRRRSPRRTGALARTRQLSPCTRAQPSRSKSSIASACSLSAEATAGTSTTFLGETIGWHWGFGAAGVGMLIGLTYFATRAGKTRPGTKVDGTALEGTAEGTKAGTKVGTKVGTRAGTQMKPAAPPKRLSPTQP